MTATGSRPRHHARARAARKGNPSDPAHLLLSPLPRASHFQNPRCAPRSSRRFLEQFWSLPRWEPNRQPVLAVLSLSARDDPVAHVVSLNLRRRHLDESQRAMVAGRLANLVQGDNRFTIDRPSGRSTQAGAAELLNVGERTVRRAARVQRIGIPEVISSVDRGDVTVTTAERVSVLPLDQQRDVWAGAVEAARGPRFSGSHLTHRFLDRANRLRASPATTCPLPSRVLPHPSPNGSWFLDYAPP